jgi:transcriptional regulator with GAF, ATPase, and Fis domain
MAHGDGGSGSDAARVDVVLVRRICEACLESLPVTGAAVSVMTTDGHRGVIDATDDTARSLEDVQFTAGEGPGCEAFATGAAVLVPDLDQGTPSAEQDWSAFRDIARELGVHAVFSFPLHLGAASLGALTIYDLKPGALDGANLARAVRLSNACAIAVLDTLAGAFDDRPGSAADQSRDGPDAEFYRVEIYQAAGMISVQLGVGIEEATLRLRSYAFANGRPIAHVARDIVRRHLRLEADNG